MTNMAYGWQIDEFMQNNLIIVKMVIENDDADMVKC